MNKHELPAGDPGNSPDSIPVQLSNSPEISRRTLLRVAAVSPLALAAAGPAGAQEVLALRRKRRKRDPLDRDAGTWQTWLAPSVAALRPPIYPRGLPVGREIKELITLQRQRSDATNAIVQFWDAQGGVPAWNQILLEKVKQAKTDPVLTARALALFHTAMADATIAVWDAKFRYRRLAPMRQDRRIRSLSSVDRTLYSYPSEHAAVAAAAATVLNYLYPTGTVVLGGEARTWDSLATEAAESRLWAGANYRSDLVAAFQMGQAIGLLAVQRGLSDGSSAVWDSVNQPGRLVGPEYWVPTPPANAFPPLHPLAGYWKPWLMASGDQFRPGLPEIMQGEFPNAAILAQTQEVKDFVDAIPQNPHYLTIAQFWADGAGTVTPPGHWMEIARQHLANSKWSAPRAARALAMLGVGVADSAICCWDSKYAFWVPRPITLIRTLSDQPFYDPAFLTPVVTPPFPSYTSGHSTFSGCSANVLEYLFPGGTATDALGQTVGFAAAADQAALSRVYGGIHYRADSDDGLTAGHSIADLVVARARQDGAD